MRSEARLPSELTLWFGPYTAIYMGGNAAYSNVLARVARPLASGWSGAEWSGVGGGASRRRSAGAASGSDHQARLPCDTGASCLLHGTGGCPARTSGRLWPLAVCLSRVKLLRCV